MRKRRAMRADVRAKDAVARRKYFDKVKMFVRAQKDNKPCMDCGVVYPFYVLHFDHRGDDPKVFMLSQAASITKAKKELAKCDLVCANCHAARTHFRHLTSFKNTVKV